MSAPDPIHPVILCGGEGRRLWPVSRSDKPKPFLPLIAGRSLLQSTLDRVADDARFAPPVIVAAAQHRALIEAQVTADHRLILEPVGCNTAPAIALATALLDPDDIILVCPSDHHIADDAAFRDAALAAAELAREDWLVCLGIAPDGPETGYGYIQRAEPLRHGYRVGRYTEKPDRATAARLLVCGDYSWNAGIFALRAGHFLAELAKHRPDMARLAAQAVESGRNESGCFYPAKDAFAAIDGDSIDRAVMENTDRAAMVEADMGWTDIGNWDALATVLEREAGEIGVGRNIAVGSADLQGSRQVFTMSDGPRISVVGLEDICVIVSGDEVLVTSRKAAENVGALPGAITRQTKE